MRLFVAVFPDEAVNAAADEALAGLDPTRWRPVARERRHVTLRFHPDADPDEVAADLRHRLVAADRPTLRCGGAGMFGSALWLGVRPDDGASWERLLAAVGADPAEHVAHLTVARGRGPALEALQGHHGPSWSPADMVLVASGTPYRVLARFPLVGGHEGVGPGR
ncbi:2'-5' RNA ligase family protein [Actinomycetospora sp. OC33-EN08]|uniref:2'-5' RNA ligase family protein n=1 Tax=Actinomycetospora aurantiaca TaxID=3129233 RepID=A0ABU8MKN0_9PSEU